MNRPVNPYFISRIHLDHIRSRSMSVSACTGNNRSRGIEERYKNYCREQSKSMTRHWSNSVDHLARQQAGDHAKRHQQRTVDDQLAYEAMREQQRREQRAEIEQIENSIRRQQPGPKLLDSAALLSNCIHVQRGQREEMALRNITNRQQVLQEGQMLRLQNHQWTVQQKQRYQENQMRGMRYKQDLQTMIEERRMMREQEMSRQQQQVIHDYPSQRTIDKERREMERRKIQLRQTATDAMRMAEQRRIREKMADKIQEKLNTIYLEGKEKQVEIITEQQKMLAEEQKQRQEMGREKVAKIIESSAVEEKAQEEKILANAADDYQQQLLARDRAEVERKKKLKAQRIQFHLEEMAAEKKRKELEEKQSQEAVNNRLTNDDVSREFAKEQREKRFKEARDLRIKLSKQWEERKENERAIKEGVQLFTNRQCDFSRDHKDFVGYAKEAVMVAKEKNWPMEPFVRAINTYGRENFVEERPLLPHLETRHPAVYYDRKELPKDNDKAVIRYNMQQLRALNPVMRG